MAEIARNTFTWGGPGAILFQLMLLGVVGGWALASITHAVGQGQVARLISVGCIFVALSLVFSLAWNVVLTVARAVGL